MNFVDDIEKLKRLTGSSTTNRIVTKRDIKFLSAVKSQQMFPGNGGNETGREHVLTKSQEVERSCLQGHQPYMHYK